MSALDPLTRLSVAPADEGVTLVEFDHPPANSLDADFHAQLSSVISTLEADDATRVVVFSSAHPTIFLSGADLKVLGATALTSAAVAERVDRAHGTFLRVQRMTKPTIAAIDGHALGGGCEFSLATDFRFMSRGKPRIGLPEVLLGLIPAGGGTQRLPRLIGRTRAAELLMLGDRLDADEAERVGILTHAVDAAVPAAMAFAHRLAAMPTNSLTAIKLCLNDGFDGSLAQGLGVERAAAMRAFVEPEAAEGIAAFLEKRAAVFHREVEA